MKKQPDVPRFPKEIIEKLNLREPKSIPKNTKVLYDGKQYSVKIPAKTSAELNLKKDEVFELIVEDSDTLKMKRVK